MSTINRLGYGSPSQMAPRPAVMSGFPCKALTLDDLPATRSEQLDLVPSSEGLGGVLQVNRWRRGGWVW